MLTRPLIPWVFQACTAFRGTRGPGASLALTDHVHRQVGFSPQAPNDAGHGS